MAKGQKSVSRTLFRHLRTLFPLLQNIPSFFIWIVSAIPNSHWCLIDWANKIKASPCNKNGGPPQLKKSWTLTKAEKMMFKVYLHRTTNIFFIRHYIKIILIQNIDFRLLFTKQTISPLSISMFGYTEHFRVAQCSCW